MSKRRRSTVGLQNMSAIRALRFLGKSCESGYEPNTMTRTIVLRPAAEADIKLRPRGLRNEAQARLLDFGARWTMPSYGSRKIQCNTNVLFITRTVRR